MDKVVWYAYCLAAGKAKLYKYAYRGIGTISVGGGYKQFINKSKMDILKRVNGDMVFDVPYNPQRR